MRSSKNIVTVPNREFSKWVERAGKEEVSRVTGLSVSGINVLLREGHIRQVYEVLATKINAEEDKTKILMVKVPAHKHEMVTTFLKGAKCRFSNWVFD